MNEIINDIKTSHKCDGCKWFQWLTPGVCGHAKLFEDCFEADDNVCKSYNSADNLYMDGKQGYNLTAPKEDELSYEEQEETEKLMENPTLYDDNSLMKELELLKSEEKKKYAEYIDIKKKIKIIEEVIFARNNEKFNQYIGKYLMNDDVIIYVVDVDNTYTDGVELIGYGSLYGNIYYDHKIDYFVNSNTHLKTISKEEFSRIINDKLEESKKNLFTNIETTLKELTEKNVSDDKSLTEVLK